MHVYDPEAQILFGYVTNEDHEGLLLYLRRLQTPINLTESRFMDKRQFTLLSYAAYKNQTNCFKVIFEYVDKYYFQRQSKENKAFYLRQWVN